MSFFNVSPSLLSVFSFNSISVLEYPFTFSSRFIVIESTFKISTIRIFPLSTYKLSTLPLPNKLHTSREKYISSLSIFLTIFPITWIHILINISHNSFSISESIGPVTVILSYSIVWLLTNSWFHILIPLSLVSVLRIIWAFYSIPIGSITLSYLYRIIINHIFINKFNYSLIEISFIDISIWVGCSTKAIIPSRSINSFSKVILYNH